MTKLLLGARAGPQWMLRRILVVLNFVYSFVSSAIAGVSAPPKVSIPLGAVGAVNGTSSIGFVGSVSRRSPSMNNRGPTRSPRRATLAARMGRVVPTR